MLVAPPPFMPDYTSGTDRTLRSYFYPNHYMVIQGCKSMEKNYQLDEKLKEAMLKRAYGYDYEEKEIIAGRNGKAEKAKIIKRHVPPDLKAIHEIQYLRSIGKW